MSRVNTVNFKQSKNADNGSRFRVFLVLFAIIIVGVLSTSLILIKNNFSLSSVLGLREDENTTAAQEETTDNQQDITTLITDDSVTDFLFICHDDKEYSFGFFVCFEGSKRSISLKSLSSDIVLNIEGKDYTLGEAIFSCNMDSIKTAFEKSGTSIDRYVSVSDNNFVSMMQLLGPVRLNLQSDFVYKVDAIKYSFSAGITELDAVAVLHYMKDGGNSAEKFSRSAECGKAITETFFTTQNVEKGQSLFGSLINLVSSDITVFDYSQAYPVIQAFCAEDFSVVIE